MEGGGGQVSRNSIKFNPSDREGPNLPANPTIAAIPGLLPASGQFELLLCPQRRLIPIDEIDIRQHIEEVTHHLNVFFVDWNGVLAPVTRHPSSMRL